MRALSLKYRPQTFDEVVGHEVIIKILKTQIEQGSVGHALLFAGKTGAGKAQPLTSLVFTKNGYIKMGDITPGTLVIDGAGNETPVLNVFPQGRRSIYRINFDDRTYIEVADNHLNSIFYTEGGKKISKVVTTLELIDLLKTKKVFVNTAEINCWDDSNITINPYLLGCLLGDGHISDDIYFTTKDQEILNNLNSILEKDYNSYFKKKISSNHDKYSYTLKDLEERKYIINYKGNQYKGIPKLIHVLQSEGYPKFDFSTILRLSKNKAKHTLKKYPELKDKIKISTNENKRVWNSNFGLRYELKKLGLLGSNSYTKFIPKAYLYSSREARLSLLQGLMDTDGFVNQCKDKSTGKNKGTSCLITTTSKQLKEDILFLARSLGFFASYREHINNTYHYVYNEKDERRPAHDYWEIRIKTNDDKCLFKLDRKKILAKSHEYEARRKITSIEYNREDECQCIYLESPEHTYLTDNLTLTHNTTVSRLLASAINEGLGTPIEIDAASNNGVDNVRAIIEDAKERAIDCTYKVYIIDEAQGLSNAAWQAFLKCIEEPPKYSIFIFCTTDPQKIPATIVNRTQKFVFKSLPDNLIANRLAEICELEGFTDYRESIEYISKVAQGCMREAITLVDKCADYSTSLSIENVSKVLGLSTFSTLFDLLNSLIDNNQASILNITEDVLRENSDPKLFVDQFLEFLINIQKFIIFNDVGVTYFSPAQIESLNYVTGLENPSGYYNYLINKLFELKVCLKDDSDPDSTIKVLFMQMGRGQ